MPLLVRKKKSVEDENVFLTFQLFSYLFIVAQLILNRRSHNTHKMGICLATTLVICILTLKQLVFK